MKFLVKVTFQKYFAKSENEAKLHNMVGSHLQADPGNILG